MDYARRPSGRKAGMSERVANEMALLFEEAERERRCVVTHDRTIARRLQRLCAAGAVVSPLRGIFYPSEGWTSLNRGERAIRIIRALAYRDPYLVFCEASAALVWGMPISWHALEYIHICARARRSGLTTSPIRWHRPPIEDVETVDGVRVTSLEETTLDCLRTLAFDDGLAIADGFLQRTGTTRSHLIELVEERWRNRQGVGQAHITASFADGRAESGGESILRAHLIELGYQIPRLQMEIPDPIDAGRHFRLDMVLRSSNGQLVDVELDGRGKYTDEGMTRGLDAEEVRRHERLRESRITAYGFQVIRLSFENACNTSYLTRVLGAFGIERGKAPQTTVAHRVRRPAAGLRCRHLELRGFHLKVKVYDRRKPRDGGCVRPELQRHITDVMVLRTGKTSRTILQRSTVTPRKDRPCEAHCRGGRF